jgi:hypothetical protein
MFPPARDVNGSINGWPELPTRWHTEKDSRSQTALEPHG